MECSCSNRTHLLCSLSHIHFDTSVTKKDSINGVMRDMYPMDPLSLLLKMHRSNPVIMIALEDEKMGLFMDVFRFSSRSMKNRNDSWVVIAFDDLLNPLQVHAKIICYLGHWLLLCHCLTICTISRFVNFCKHSSVLGVTLFWDTSVSSNDY